MRGAIQTRKFKEALQGRTHNCPYCPSILHVLPVLQQPDSLAQRSSGGRKGGMKEGRKEEDGQIKVLQAGAASCANGATCGRKAPSAAAAGRSTLALRHPSFIRTFIRNRNVTLQPARSRLLTKLMLKRAQNILLTPDQPRN